MLQNRWARYLVFLGVAASALLLVAACTDRDVEPTAAVSPTPTVEATPSSTATPSPPTATPAPRPTSTPRPTPTPEIAPHREEAIQALQWVADGIAPGQEPTVYENLLLLAKRQTDLFDVAIVKPWLDVQRVWEGDPSMAEMLVFAITTDAALANAKPEVFAMPFMDTLNEGDITAARFLLRMLRSDPDGYGQFLGLPDHEEGIPDGEDVIGRIVLGYLAMSAPEHSLAVTEIPWLIDEREEAEEFLGVVIASPATVAVLLGHYSTEQIPPELAAAFHDLARRHPPASVRAALMPFAETYDDSDVRLVELLRSISRNNREDLDKVLTAYEETGGIRESDLLTLELINLELSHPELSAVLAELPWVQDGADIRERDWVSTNLRNEGEIVWNPYIPPQFILESEERVLQALMGYAAKRNAADVPLLAQKAWVRDGVDALEFQIIEQALDVSRAYRLEDLSIAAMPFLDTPEYVDLDVLKTLDDIRDLSRNGEEAISISAFAGGITDESAPYLHVIALEAVQPEAAGIVKASLNTPGRLTPEEEYVVRMLRYFVMHYPDLLSSALRTEWASDGINGAEVDLIGELRKLDRERALQLLDMPFLQDIDSLDLLAVDALWKLESSGNWRRFTTYVEVDLVPWILGRDIFVGGIGEEDVLTLSVLDDFARTIHPPSDVSLADKVVTNALTELLSPGGLVFRETTARFTGGESATVKVVHPGTLGLQPGTVSLFADTAEYLVDYLDAPVIEAQFILIGQDRWGERHGDGDPFVVGERTIITGKTTMANELRLKIAQPLRATWLDDSLGSFLVHLYGDNIPGSEREILDFDDFQPECRGIESLLAGLERGIRSAGTCQSSVGPMLSAELYFSLSEQAFKDGARATYAFAREDILRARSLCGFESGGICHLWEGFITQATPANAAIAAPIINKWYFGSEQGYIQD